MTAPVSAIHLADAEIELYDDGLTLTRYPDGLVEARPQDDDAYRARAEALGYGADTAAMSREHEVIHSWLAAMLGLPRSPTLNGVAQGSYWAHWRAEESAILGVQRYARLAGVDILEVALRASIARR